MLRAVFYIVWDRGKKKKQYLGKFLESAFFSRKLFYTIKFI